MGTVVATNGNSSCDSGNSGCCYGNGDTNSGGLRDSFSLKFIHESHRLRKGRIEGVGRYLHSVSAMDGRMGRQTDRQSDRQTRVNQHNN